MLPHICLPRSSTGTARCVTVIRFSDFVHLCHVHVHEYWFNSLVSPAVNGVYHNCLEGVRIGKSKHSEAGESMTIAERQLLLLVRFILHLKLGEDRQLGNDMYEFLLDLSPPEHKAS